MTFEEVQIEFVGISPEREMRNLIATIAERLHFSAPSDSAIRVGMSKDGRNKLHASCRIASKAGTFIAVATGQKPAQTLALLEQKVNDQLLGWKRTRFAHNNFQNGLLG